MPISKTVSVSSFQQCDGSNFTTAGIEAGQKFGDIKLSTYAGIGTEFSDNLTGAVVDFKGCVPYGNSLFSGGFRVRNNINPNSQSVQFRLQPCSVNIPVGENTSIYATPYVATKVKHNSGYDSTKVGTFAGISQKVGENTRVFVEGQLYDVTKVNSNTTSVNAGISVSF